MVDDRQENIFSLKSLLEDLNVEIHSALSGSEALELMVNNDYALAIVDVQMPEMDGFELAELMRGAEKTRDVPLMFVTAAAKTPNFQFRGYELGAVDFLLKPIDTTILKCKVQVFIELAEKRMLLKQKVRELELAKKAAEAAKESAERANRLKSAFLANMSHEIRTPLGALMGFTELLKLSDNEQDRATYAEVIIRNGKALVQLIDEILDLSKVEAGHLETEMASVSAKDLTREIFHLLEPSASKKNLKLYLQMSSGVPDRIGTDPMRLRQILVNIIGNAIKFTVTGSITVDVSYDKNGVKPAVVFEVRDTGIGIPADKSQKLFLPFSQIDPSVSRRFGGTGLGLALSKKLSVLLGGDVELVSSTPDVGSVFRVRIEDRFSDLKLQLATDKEVPGPSRSLKRQENAILEGVRVLVVDDSPDNRFLVQMYLKKVGAKVDFAVDGQDGSQKALNGNFDMILMDIQMPICDGLQATKILRSQGYRRPIVALTANAMSEERGRCLEAGCNEYLSKPIDREKLISTIDRFVHREEKELSQNISL